MRGLVERAISVVAGHPAVTRVALAGSRSRGTHEALSDWDFAVDTDDFASVARDLPALVQPLEPVAGQWEPLGHFPAYMLVLRGPTKVEYLFLDHAQTPRPPLQPSREALPAIDAHFWDWIWWLATKASAGRDDLVEPHWPRLHRYLLEPLNVETMPVGVETAIREFLARRSGLEGRYGVEVPRALEREILGGIRRLGYDV